MLNFFYVNAFWCKFTNLEENTKKYPNDSAGCFSTGFVRAGKVMSYPDKKSVSFCPVSIWPISFWPELVSDSLPNTLYHKVRAPLSPFRKKTPGYATASVHVCL